ncbi:hypothetical protein MPTA9241_6990 [Mycoplasmoides pneumoniae]
MTAEKELGIHDFDENLNEQSLLKQLMPKTRNITLEPTRETITVPLERNIVERSFFGELDQLEKEQSIRNFFHFMVDMGVVKSQPHVDVLNHFANQLQVHKPQTVDLTMEFLEQEGQEVLTKEIKAGFCEITPSSITEQTTKPQLDETQLVDEYVHTKELETTPIPISFATKEVLFEEVFNTPLTQQVDESVLVNEYIELTQQIKNASEQVSSNHTHQFSVATEPAATKAVSETMLLDDYVEMVEQDVQAQTALPQAALDPTVSLTFSSPIDSNAILVYPEMKVPHVFDTVAPTTTTVPLDQTQLLDELVEVPVLTHTVTPAPLQPKAAPTNFALDQTQLVDELVTVPLTHTLVNESAPVTPVVVTSPAAEHSFSITTVDKANLTNALSQTVVIKPAEDSAHQSAVLDKEIATKQVQLQQLQAQIELRQAQLETPPVTYMGVEEYKLLPVQDVVPVQPTVSFEMTLLQEQLDKALKHNAALQIQLEEQLAKPLQYDQSPVLQERIELLQNQNTNLTQELNELQQKLFKSQNNSLLLARLEEENRTLKQHLQNNLPEANQLNFVLEKQLEQLQQDKHSLTLQIEQYKFDSKKHQEQLALIPSLRSEINSLETEVISLKQTNQRLSLIERENNFLKTEIKQLRETKLNDENTKYRNLLKQYELMRADSDAKLKELEHEQHLAHQHHQEQLAQLQRHNEALVKELDQVKATNFELGLAAQGFEQQKVVLEQKNSSLLASLQAAEENVHALGITNSELQNQLNVLEFTHKEKTAFDSKTLTLTKQQLEQTQFDLSLTQEQLATFKQQNQSLTDKLMASETQLNHLQQSDENLTQLQTQHELLQESYNKLQDEANHTQQQFHQAQNELDAAHQQLALFKQNNEELTDKCSNIQNELHDLNRVKTNWENLNTEHNLLQDKYAQQKEQMQHEHSNLAQIQAEHELLQESYNKVKAELNEIQITNLNEANAQYQDLLSAYELLQSNHNKLKQELQVLNQVNLEKQQLAQKLHNTHQSLSQTHAELTQLQAAYNNLQATPPVSDELLEQFNQVQLEKQRLLQQNLALVHELQYFNELNSSQTHEIKTKQDETVKEVIIVEKEIPVLPEKKPRLKKRDIVIENKEDALGKLSKKERIQAYAERLAKINGKQ